jgi:hypothetical protein
MFFIKRRNKYSIFILRYRKIGHILWYIVKRRILLGCHGWWLARVNNLLSYYVLSVN